MVHQRHDGYPMEMVKNPFLFLDVKELHIVEAFPYPGLLAKHLFSCTAKNEETFVAEFGDRVAVSRLEQQGVRSDCAESSSVDGVHDQGVV